MYAVDQFKFSSQVASPNVGGAEPEKRQSFFNLPVKTASLGPFPVQHIRWLSWLLIRLTCKCSWAAASHGQFCVSPAVQPRCATAATQRQHSCTGTHKAALGPQLGSTQEPHCLPFLGVRHALHLCTGEKPRKAQLHILERIERATPMLTHVHQRYR